MQRKRITKVVQSVLLPLVALVPPLRIPQQNGYQSDASFDHAVHEIDQAWVLPQRRPWARIRKRDLEALALHLCRERLNVPGQQKWLCDSYNTVQIEWLTSRVG